MAVFALLGLLPIFTYALIQAWLDWRRKKPVMLLWGILIALLCGWGIIQVFLRPGY